MSQVALPFEDGPAPAYGADLLVRLRAKCPQVFMVCFRNKNKNVVVYQANTTPDGQTLLDPPVVAYWLNLEPSYMEARRQKGIAHDREDLNYWDTKFAWGFSATRDSDTQATFKFQNMPDVPTIVKLNQTGAQLFISYEGRKYNLRSLFICASEDIKIINPQDNVKELYLNALDISEKPYKAKKIYIKGDPVPNGAKPVVVDA